MYYPGNLNKICVISFPFSAIVSYFKDNVGSQVIPWYIYRNKRPGELSRECILRIPMRVVKGD